MNAKVFSRCCCLCLFMVTLGCEKVPDESKVLRPKVIAVINNQEIFKKEFEDFLIVRREPSVKQKNKPERNAIFKEFLVEKLLLQEAREEKITLEDDEIQQLLNEWLAEEQKATPVFYERVQNFLMVQKLLRKRIGLHVNVSVREMQNYYSEHNKEFHAEDQMHLLEIRVGDLSSAEEIRQKMTFGDVRSFKKLARMHSQGLTANKGGDLGTFTRGQLPKDFEEFVFTLKPGEVSSVFHSAEDYHIFMMEEWIPRHPQKFYEVQDIIFERLVMAKERAARDSYVRQIVDRASIELHDKSLAVNWGESNEDAQ